MADIVKLLNILIQGVTNMANIVNEVLSEKEVVCQEKYLIDLKNSDLSKVTGKSAGMKFIQTYLMATENEERRLRKVIMKDGVNYYYSVFRINMSQLYHSSCRLVNKYIQENIIYYILLALFIIVTWKHYYPTYSDIYSQ